MFVDTEAGPPPPYDPECGAVLATLPSFPPLTLDSIPAMRAGAAAYMPRPTNAELARGGSYSVEERTVPGPPGAPDVALIICTPVGATATAAVPALYCIHGGGMISGTARDALGDLLDLAEQVGAALVSVEYRLAPETPHPGPGRCPVRPRAPPSRPARRSSPRPDRDGASPAPAGTPPTPARHRPARRGRAGRRARRGPCR